MRPTVLIALLIAICVTNLTSRAEPLPPTITRSDVAAAAERFENGYAAHPPATDEQRARVHAAYDNATILYLNAKHAETIAALNDLSNSLLQPAPSTAMKVMQSLQVRVAPPVAMRTRPSVLRVRVAPMYGVQMDAPVELKLVIRSDAPNPTTIFEAPVRIEPGSAPFTLTRAQPQAAMGKYVVELVAPDKSTLAVQRWTVVETPLEVLRAGNDRRLIDLRPDSEPMRQALVACRARNTLLSDHPDENSPAQFLPVPLDLSREVQSEVEWVTMGKDPYTNKAGDYWRAMTAGAMQMPVRVYAPQAACAGNNQPVPLVIALHDSVGDESRFMDCYGDGQIKKLADQYGFLVVAPNTHWVMRNAATLDAIVEAISYNYPIDKSRVYLIGHSLGATAACAMAANQPEKIAAMALFAGGNFANVTKLPPTLVIQGDADQLVPASRTDGAVQQAKSSGLPVELRILKDRGHTLLVNDELRTAVEWLMKQKTHG